MKIVTVTLLGSITALFIGTTGMTRPDPPASGFYVDSMVVEPGNGYGSAIALVPGRTDEFYLMTDRGPNVDGPSSDSKIFLEHDFTPRIGRFRTQGNTLQLLDVISLKNSSGEKLSGLPNPLGAGGTGETAYDTRGHRLSPDAEGIDPEGMVALKDGSFWISDEYGPHLLHVDRQGKTLERLSPYSAQRRLPRVLARRRPNRGMEGVTVTPDGRYLVGIMQGPLNNPGTAAASASRTIRLLKFDLLTGKSAEYLYTMEDPRMRVSDITAIDNDHFLVLERDDHFYDPQHCPVKKIFRISLQGATNVHDPADGPSGLLFGGKTAEQLDAAEYAAHHLQPVQKTLTVNIMKAIPDYPHDKAEGLVLINRRTIALCNDDDFGVTDGGGGVVARKILPATGERDRNVVYFIHLEEEL